MDSRNLLWLFYRRKENEKVFNWAVHCGSSGSDRRIGMANHKDLTGEVHSREEYDRARESYVSAIQPKEKEEGEEEDDPFPDLEIDIKGLLAENPDFVSWLYYEDAKINYPVVQENSVDVNKYLKTTFNGTENSAGCVFIPYDADPAFRYKNTFLYGHNMKDGSMFGG